VGDCLRKLITKPFCYDFRTNGGLALKRDGLVGWRASALSRQLFEKRPTPARFFLRLLDSISSLQACREEDFIEFSIWVFRAGMAASAGLRALISSCSEMSDLAKLGSPGMKSFLKPDGMLCFEAVTKTSLRIHSLLAQDVGGSGGR
jgi:hypothetical protein